MRFETDAVHYGYQPDASGAISQGLTLATTFERLPDGGFPQGYQYSRDGNPNRASLERTVARLERGEEAYAYASGLAAMNAVLQLLKPGDHLIAPTDSYYAFGKILREYWMPLGIQ